MMHRDLKTENIYLKENICKIGDFGFSTTKSITDSVIGTPYYINPKIIKGMETNGKEKDSYDKNIDAWSLGVILY